MLRCQERTRDENRISQISNRGKAKKLNNNKKKHQNSKTNSLCILTHGHNLPFSRENEALLLELHSGLFFIIVELWVYFIFFKVTFINYLKCNLVSVVC